LSPEEALAIVPKICEALQYAHQQGVVHRDIKPENILIDKGGQLKIADFGIAKMMGQQVQTGLTQEQQVIGTPHYMAPEQVERPKTVDHRADIYSLGVVLYEMLTGELPLGKFALPSRKVQVDVRLDEVVLHALEKEPERRYQEAQQVKTDVEAIRSGPAGQSSAAGMGTSPRDNESDKHILPAFLLALFFGVFGAHRFYVGKIWTGLMQLGVFAWCVLLVIACALDSWPGQPTLGVLLGFSILACIIMATIDWILLACRAFTDGSGKRITQWVRDGNGQSQPDGPGTPISQSGAAPPAASQPPGSVSSKIIAPGVAMMVAGFLKLSGAAVGLLFLTGMDIPALANLPGFHFNFPHNLGALAGGSIFTTRIIPALLILFGGYQMVQMRSYAWSLTASIFSLISCSLISFPIGIWALIVLRQPDVRAAFDNARSTPRKAGAFPWTLVTMIVVASLLIIGLFAVGSEFLSNRLLAASNDDSDTTALVESTDDSAGAETNSLPIERNATNQTSLTTAPGNTNSSPRVVRSGSAANFTRSFVIGPGGKLRMNVDRGDVRISGSDQNSIEVQVTREVTRTGNSTAARVIKDHHIELRQNGNELSITARTPSFLKTDSLFDFFFARPNLEVHYEITVPRKCDVDSQTAGGEVNVTQIQGSVKAQTMGGRVELADIQGAADAGTMGGDVTVGKCTGDLHAHTAGGSIKVEEFSGPSVRAETSGGNVSADFLVAPHSDCELRTMGGNVTARLPASAAFTVEADTMGGSVNTELPVQIEGKHKDSHLHGTVNGGGPVLKLHTMGGNIEITGR
jgi:DUF4097 and DUF4098 domain-containing protein YvlB